MAVYLRVKFEVSSVILTSFKQGRVGGWGNFTPPPPQNEPLKSPLRLGLKKFNNSKDFIEYSSDMMIFIKI